MRELDQAAVDAAVAGGSVLAAGGGGWVWHGELVGRTAVSYGTPVLASLDEVAPDAVLVTVTAIGAPAAERWEIRPQDYVRALRLLMDALDVPVAGTITAQNGSSTTLNGWMQSAVLGTLVVDAAGDGRAHPTGKMGSMGLTSDAGYRTVQSAAGGVRAQDRYVEVVSRGTVAACANVLRRAAVESGGFIAAARNPMPAALVRERGAVGAITFALRLGEAMLGAAPRGGAAVMDAVTGTLGGRILTTGEVRGRTIRTEGAFDIGALSVGDVELGVVNEYLTAEAGGERLATFPDVLATLSPDTGRPVSIADIRDGDAVAVLHVPKDRVPLGAGVHDPSVYPEVEAMLGLPLAEFALA